MSTVDQVRQMIEPLVIDAGVELYDLEHEGGVLRVVLDRSGGIDVDTIGDISQRISVLLDHNDPFPGKRYLLEVSSPGIERRMRTREHFQAQLGAEVAVKVRMAVDGARRFQGLLIAVTEKNIEIEEIEIGVEAKRRRFSYGDIENARTVFHWKDSPEPVPPKHSTKTNGHTLNSENMNSENMNSENSDEKASAR